MIVDFAKIIQGIDLKFKVIGTAFYEIRKNILRVYKMSLCVCRYFLDKQYITLDNSITLLYTVYTRRKYMKIIINHSSMQPIYEQITDQIKAMLIDGTLQEEEMLPSVRTLAKELKISALTVKKAYDFLEEEGFVVTVHGKGSFIAKNNQGLLMEERKREIETELEGVIRKARVSGLSDEEIRELFELIMEE